MKEFGGPAMASGTDPTDHRGFYPYEVERGTDVHSFWYRSPGRPAGGDGDFGRPADAAEYIGMKRPEGSEEPTEEGAPEPEAAADKT